MVAFYRTCFQLLPVLLSLINSMVLKLECRDSDWWRYQFNLFADNACWWCCWWWLLPLSSPGGLHRNFFQLAPLYWSAWLEARSWLHITDWSEFVMPLATSEQISKKRGNFDVVGVGTRSDLGNAQIKCIYMLASSSVSQNISIPWEKAGSKWDWQWRLSKLPQATFARLPFLCHLVSKSPEKFWMKYPSLWASQVSR